MGLNLGGGFARGVLQGQSIFQNFHDQYQKGEQARELADVANAKATESTGFTADQGKQLESLASQGFDNITFDDKANAYTAKNAAGESKTVAMGGVTDYMGNRMAGGVAENKVAINQQRMQAIADVIGKQDPVRGVQMRNEADKMAFEAKRQGREEKQWAEEDAITAIDTGLGKDFQASLVDGDGKARAATVDDYLTQSQKRVAALSAGGHAKAAGEELQKNLAWTHTKIQLDGKAREEAFGKAAYAAANGDYSPMQDAYNKYVPDGMKVTGVDVGKDGTITMNRVGADGKAAEPKVFKSRDELLATMNTLNNPMALYQYAGSEQQRALQLKQDARADNADARSDRQLNEQIRHNRAQEGRAAATHAASMADRKELRDVREALARESDPNLTPTQIRAIRAGLIQTPGADKSNVKYEFDPVRLHKMFGETSVDPLTGKETVKRNPAEEKKFMEYMGDNPSIRDLDEGLVKYNRAKTQAEKKERAQQPPKISGAAEYAKLPSGARFTDPNGAVRVKP